MNGPVLELLLGSPGVRALLTLRAAGDMNLRIRPCQAAMSVSARFFPRARLIVPVQNHTRTVVVADEEADLREADGIVTADPALVLGVTVADCLPIYIHDRQSNARGLLHSGWKGTGIVETGVELMGTSFGSRPEDLSVAFGPCIGTCCYRVEEDRAEAFAARHGRSSVCFRDGSWRIDLVEANRLMLDRMGVRGYTVHRECSACSERLGSFRREGPSFTRMLALLGIVSD